MKKESTDAMDHLIDEKDISVEEYEKRIKETAVDDEGNAVSIDGLHKTKFGLWKELELQKPHDRDPYLAGHKHECQLCGTCYNTYLLSPICPFCHCPE